MTVKTSRVANRRKVAYQSLAEVLADAERLSSGPVTTLGNWSPGQIFRHLATAYNASIDGFTMTFPWYLRVMGQTFRRMLLTMPMPAGIPLPSSGANLMMREPTSTEDGLAELRAAITRLERDHDRAPHPVFGVLTRDEWNKVHLHHADLHMSFLVPQ